MFERYTDDAKHAIYFAATEAQHRNAESVLVGDLLIALTREPLVPSPASVRLHELAVPLRASIGLPHLPITSRPYKFDLESPLPLHSDSRRAIKHAEIAADQDKEYWIDCDHLLRGLLAFSNEANSALEISEIDLYFVRKSFRGFRRDCPAPTVPMWRAIRLLPKWYPYSLRCLSWLGVLALMAVILVLVIRVRSAVN